MSANESESECRYTAAPRRELKRAPSPPLAKQLVMAKPRNRPLPEPPLPPRPQDLPPLHNAPDVPKAPQVTANNVPNLRMPNAPLPGRGGPTTSTHQHGRPQSHPSSHRQPSIGQTEERSGHKTGANGSSGKLKEKQSKHKPGGNSSIPDPKPKHGSQGSAHKASKKHKDRSQPSTSGSRGDNVPPVPPRLVYYP